MMKTVATILLVDPDEALQQQTVEAFGQNGFDVIVSSSAESILSLLDNPQFQLIVTEILLPGISGIEFCRMVRSTPGSMNIPFMIVSALKSETDRVVGLSVGATDYVTKPFSQRELMLRIRAILRRTMSVDRTQDFLTNGRIRLDPDRTGVWVNEVPVRLSRLEYLMLKALLRNQGHPMTRPEIMRTVWHTDSGVQERTVDSHVRILRSKLGEAREDLETVQNAGYRLAVHSSERWKKGDLVTTMLPNCSSTETKTSNR